MKIKIQTVKICLFLGCLIITTAVFLPSAVSAKDYYVSTTGNDSSAGTESTPFRTIKFAIGSLVGGDTLFIRGGTYKEALLSHAGTKFPSGTSWSAPVKVAAYKGEQVVLMGKIAIGLASPPTQYLVFDGIKIDAQNYDAGIVINGGAHHIRFQNGELKNATSNGATLSYNNVMDSGSVDVFNEFINMDIHHNGSGIDGNADHGLYIKTSGNLIENCKIHDNLNWGVHQYVYPIPAEPDSNNNIIRNNVFWGNGVVAKNGGAIVMGSGRNNLAYNNVIYNNQNGIQVTGGNIPYDNLVYNNTLYSNVGFGILANTKSVKAQFIYNILFKNNPNIQDLGQSTLSSMNETADPNFVDEANGNFHLVWPSPAIDRAKPLEVVKMDFDGKKRSEITPEIGAFEYSSQSMESPILRVVNSSP